MISIDCQPVIEPRGAVARYKRKKCLPGAPGTSLSGEFPQEILYFFPFLLSLFHSDRWIPDIARADGSVNQSGRMGRILGISRGCRNAIRDFLITFARARASVTSPASPTGYNNPAIITSSLNGGLSYKLADRLGDNGIELR